jgi:peptidoglycan DL-endopeptidase LytE
MATVLKISSKRCAMDRQCMMILLVALMLWLPPKNLVFAEESSAGPEGVRIKLVKMARSFLGLPYRWGGTAERKGVDCSGLVKILFAKLHIELPRTSREQIQSGEKIAVEDLEKGDLLFFSADGATPNHVGLYIGDKRFVHAAKNPGKVIISGLDQPWYTSHFLGARRILTSPKQMKDTEGE